MTEERKQKKKRTVFDVIRAVVLIAAVAVFCYSGFRLFTIYQEYKAGTDEYSSLEDFVKLPQKDNEAGGESVPGAAADPVITVETEANGETERFMESPVDFGELKGFNKDVIGWINVEALDVSYPVVQGKDNDYYLHRTFKKADNFAGSIFMESMNNPGFKDQNTIIYGHNMKNGSMFGTLKNFRDQETYEKSPYIWVYTPKMNYKYQIFSCHEVGAVSGTYQLTFAKDKDYKKYLEEMTDHSEVKMGVKTGIKDKIITLSTCTGNEATRFVVQGKLVDSIKVK